MTDSSILEQVITTGLTILASVGGSLIVAYAMIRAKLAAHDVEIASIHERLNRRDEAANREAGLLSRELMDMRKEQKDSIDKLTDLVTNVRLNCVGHEGILRDVDILIAKAINETVNKLKN